VRKVVEESPAEKAGLKEDDIIVAIDGEPILSAADVPPLIQAKAPARRSRSASCAATSARRRR